MLKLRDYQERLSTEISYLLPSRKILYLNGECRSGKSLIALETCKKVNAKKVLFITKIKAFSSIQSDYNNFGYTYELTIINKESLHTILTDEFDLIVCDESHQYCFLGDTLIDGIKIKDIKVGSFQKSYNFAKGIYEDKKVLNVFKNELTQNLIKIKCNGKEIICTENHEIFTKRGWIKAGEILPTDELQVV